MPRKVSSEIISKRFQIQVKEIESLRNNSVKRFGITKSGIPDDRYTDYVTCQGTQPSRLSGDWHKKCGKQVSIMYAYKCLYCNFWFCGSCAEIHFGKTREQYYNENIIGV